MTYEKEVESLMKQTNVTTEEAENRQIWRQVTENQ
jgi:hypothetical protein